MPTDTAGGGTTPLSGDAPTLVGAGEHRVTCDPQIGELPVTVTLLLARLADRPVTEVARAVGRAVDGDALDRLVSSSPGLSTVEFVVAGYVVRLDTSGELCVTEL